MGDKNKMIKYILNSGGARNHPDRAKEFFAEIVDGLGNTPRMLVCFFCPAARGLGE
jgi:hypothetical protein